jgi:hypothetical protein
MHLDEKKKIRTRSSLRSQDNTALLALASTEPSTFSKSVEHK